MRYAMPSDNPYSLKSFKEMTSLSEETMCFSAKLLRDGKVIGDVSNRGHGGSNDIRLGLAESNLLETYCKTLPPDTFEDGTDLKMDEDYFITCLADDEAQKKFRAKEAKKWVKRCTEYSVFRYVGDKKGTWRISQTRSKTPLTGPLFDQHVAKKGTLEAYMNDLIGADPFVFEKF